MLLSLCMLTVSALQAQEVITGTVVDGKNEPIPGVRVEVPGRSETTTTDIDGTFRLDLPVAVKKLVFHYIGYKPVERNVTPEMYVKLGHGWAGNTSGYRGFFDLLPGFGSGGVVNISEDQYAYYDLGKYSIGMGFTTSHGYQINRCFYAGLGFGAYILTLYSINHSNWDDYIEYNFHGINIPAFAEFRWDYDLTATTTPFADLKIGYQYSLPFKENDYYNVDTKPASCGGLFLMPTIGMRRAVCRKFAINIGVSYNIIVPRSFKIDHTNNSYFPDGESSSENISKKITSKGGMAMLNISLDF